MALDPMYILLWALGLAVGYYGYKHFKSTGKPF